MADIQQNEKNYSDDWPDFKCRQCGRYKPQDPSAFRCGDEVVFNEVLQLSSGPYVRVMSGVIIEAEADSVLINVNFSKSIERVSRTEMWLPGSPGPRVYELFGVCRCDGCK